jgi:hypothetical protein
MQQRCEADPDSLDLLDETASHGRSQRAHCKVRVAHVGNVIHPVDRKSLELLRTFLAIHVLDKATYFDVGYVRGNVCYFRRERARPKNKKLHSTIPL